jgi:hypothetical protein
MKVERYMYWAVIVGLLIALFLKDGCNSGSTLVPWYKKCPKCPTIDTTTTIDYEAKYDSLTRKIEFVRDSVPPPEIIKQPYPVEVEAVISSEDTLAILAMYEEIMQDYYQMRVYNLP